MQFLQVVQNPVLAPFAKMDYVIAQIAESMDLDPDKVTNSMADAAIQAEMLKGMQQELPPVGPDGQPLPPTGGGSAPQGGNPAGAGAMGIGGAPGPGAPGFSANTGEGQ